MYFLCQALAEPTRVYEAGGKLPGLQSSQKLDTKPVPEVFLSFACQPHIKQQCKEELLVAQGLQQKRTESDEGIRDF